MTKYWCATVALMAVIASPALAQTLNSSTTTATETVTTTPPPVVDTRTTKTEKSVNANGVETDKRQTVTNGPAGSSSSTSVQKTGPDGQPLVAAHHEETVSPSGDKTTSSQTTTTSPGR